MSKTNFAKLTDEQYTIWSRDLWKHAREKSFVNQFVGTGTNSIIQRVTDLKRDAKGDCGCNGFSAEPPKPVLQADKL